MATSARDAGSPLRVLRLTPYIYLPGRRLTRRELQYEPVGGMQVQIAQLADRMDDLGVPQTVLAPRRPGLPARVRTGANTTLRLVRVPVVPFRTRSKGYLGLLVGWTAAATTWSVVQRLRRNDEFDLVHVHCSELPWTFVCGVAVAGILRRPLAMTVHCSALVTFHPETALGRLLIGPARAAERFALRRAAAVIVLTDRVRRAYVAAGVVDPHRVHVIPDGVSLSTFRAPAPRRAPDPGDPIVLYCGRFAPEKGWADFVRAAAELVRTGRPARFAMCGDGNELSRCRADVERLGLRDHVDLLGHLDRDAVADLIRRAAVVVVPSRHEELGGTVLEALASARPVVATDVGGLPEVVQHERTGLLVPPADPPALAAAVARLLDDPAFAARLGRAGAAQVARYDADAVAGSVRHVYERAARRATAPAAAAAVPARADRVGGT